jgi:hypothetical protein
VSRAARRGDAAGASNAASFGVTRRASNPTHDAAGALPSAARRALVATGVAAPR